MISTFTTRRHAAVSGVFAVTTLLALAPANAAVTLDTAVITLGDYTASGGRVDGAILVGGNADINSHEIGKKLGRDSDKSAVVTVAGDIAYRNSKLSRGRVVYGGANKGDRWTDAETREGGFTRDKSLDTAAITEFAIATSKELAGLPATGKFESQWSVGTLTGSGGTDIFTLTTDELNKVSALVLAGKAGGKAIINISGEYYGGFFKLDAGEYAPGDILFNFVDARKIEFAGTMLGGSILAPFAALYQYGGLIGGNVVAGSYSSFGGEVDGKAFSGFTNAGVPEPASWAMLVTGFLLVGGQLRRRQRPVAA